MIELTEEMIAAYRTAARRAGLRAVLAIVDRDLPDVPALIRNAYERGQKDERTLTALLGPPKGDAS